MDTFHILFTLWAETVEDMDCEIKIFGKVSVFIRDASRPKKKETEKSNWVMMRDMITYMLL